MKKLIIITMTFINFLSNFGLLNFGQRRGILEKLLSPPKFNKLIWRAN